MDFFHSAGEERGWRDWRAVAEGDGEGGARNERHDTKGDISDRDIEKENVCGND